MAKSRKSLFSRTRELFVGHKGRRLNDLGQEVPDPTPMAPPIGYKPAPSLTEQIREMVRSEHLRRAAEDMGAETFEEADDFDMPDDPLDPSTPYERVFEGLSAIELRQRERELRAAADKAAAAAAANSPAEPVAAAREGRQVKKSPAGTAGVVLPAEGPSEVE